MEFEGGKKIDVRLKERPHTLAERRVAHTILRAESPPNDNSIDVMNVWFASQQVPPDKAVKRPFCDEAADILHFEDACARQGGIQNWTAVNKLFYDLETAFDTAFYEEFAKRKADESDCDYQ